ncbi:hypothetical protein KU306_12395 [Haloferax larsenii]|uniref:Uncharacterized protein n=1 Tax=Haloferax larsenii TaxID=302484 RepID=A0ABY5RC13_HALLR|nr:hypothetical protein [Haloferax larsenii]UVE49704.1 hypothetical protein KU306_12395 [Haloferax larsenii]
MPSTRTTYVAAVVAGLLPVVLSFPYFNPFAGLLTGVSTAVAVLLLSDIADNGYSTEPQRWVTLAAVVGACLFFGDGLLSARPILESFVPMLLLPPAAIAVLMLGRLSFPGYPESLGRRRSLTTGLVVSSLVAYGAFHGAVGLLAGISTGVLAGLVSWLTSPLGPLLDTADDS